MIRRILIFIVVFLGCWVGVTAQTQEKDSDPAREELQRYLGYEPGVSKFISLPYDLTMGVNINGNYQNIGFMLLGLVGFLLLFASRKRWWTFVLSLFLLILMGSVSLYYGKIGTTKDHNASLAEFDNASFSATHPTIKAVYEWNHRLMAPIMQPFESISQKEDFLSYWYIVGGAGLLFALMFLWRERFSHTKVVQLSLFAIFTAALWLYLSAGVIWYGFVSLVAIATAILYGIQSIRETWVRLGLISVLLAWCLAATIFKSANMYYLTDAANFMVDPPVWQYYSGSVDEEVIYNGYYKELSKALRILNRAEDTKIYKAGTSFNVFITDSERRIFKDNLLSFYNNLTKRYEEHEIPDVLYANGFRYVIVGLRTWYMDQSPEKTLKKKYISFYDLLVRQPQFELVATDRTVKLPDGTQKQQLAGEIVNYGYYALFRINE